MGAGDRYQQPSFTVPMPAGVKTWPLPAPRPPRAYCPLCDRPIGFCDCDCETTRPLGGPNKQGDTMRKNQRGFTSPAAAMALLVAVLFLALLGLAVGSEGTGTEGFCERHGCGAPAEGVEPTPCPEPEPCPEPAPCPSCPLPPACDSCCGTETSTTTTTTLPDSPGGAQVCPQVCAPAEKMIPCKVKRDGTLLCPRRGHPRRLLVPESLAY